MKVYNYHQTLSVRAGLPHLRPCRARSFASNSRNNFRAFPSSPLGSHIFSQHTILRSQRRLSRVEYLCDFPLRLLDLYCITLSLSLLKSRWAGGNTAARAGYPSTQEKCRQAGCRDPDPGPQVCYLRNVRLANHFPKYKCVFYTHLDC